MLFSPNRSNIQIDRLSENTDWHIHGQTKQTREQKDNIHRVNTRNVKFLDESKNGQGRFLQRHELFIPMKYSTTNKGVLKLVVPVPNWYITESMSLPCDAPRKKLNIIGRSGVKTPFNEFAHQKQAKNTIALRNLF